jgi:hypothetical protein
MLDITFMLLAFAGGVSGAVFGALPNFIFCGLLAIVGAGLTIATGNDHGFTANVAFGPLFGPHIGFAGGAAAAAYAASKGKLANGRDIATALMGLDSWDVLLVGGLFGVLGYLLTWALNFIPNIGAYAWTNTVALSIVINAIIARLMFGKKGVFGKVRAGDSRWVPTDVGSWVPWESRPTQLIMVSIAVALPAAYFAKNLGDGGVLGFGIGAACLIFLQYGTKVPVTHHIALAAGMATAASKGDIFWGLSMGLLAAFMGEIWACVFTAHADTHIDPPSAALATVQFVIPVVSVTGAFAMTGVAPIVVAVVIAAAGYFLMTGLRGQQKMTPARA